MWTTPRPGGTCCCTEWGGVCRCPPGARPRATRNRSGSGGRGAGPRQGDRGEPGRLGSLRGRVRRDVEAAEKGAPGIEGRTWAARGLLSLAALVATRPGHRPRLIYRICPRSPWDEPARGVHRGRLRRPARRRLSAARRLARAGLGQLNTPHHQGHGRAHRARSWLTVYRLPTYAHKLNSIQLVWSHLKWSLANLTKHTIAGFTALIKTGPRPMQ